MVEYKLTIVKVHSRGYQAGIYHKARPTSLPSFPQVIDYVLGLSLEVLKKDPCYVDLKDNEISILEHLRRGVIKRDLSLEIRVKEEAIEEHTRQLNALLTA